LELRLFQVILNRIRKILDRFHDLAGFTIRRIQEKLERLLAGYKRSPKAANQSAGVLQVP